MNGAMQIALQWKSQKDKAIELCDMISDSSKKQECINEVNRLAGGNMDHDGVSVGAEDCEKIDRVYHPVERVNCFFNTGDMQKALKGYNDNLYYMANAQQCGCACAFYEALQAEGLDPVDPSWHGCVCEKPNICTLIKNTSNVATCNSCEDCIEKLNGEYSVIRLVQDISSSGTCIDNPSGFNNKIFDRNYAHF